MSRAVPPLATAPTAPSTPSWADVAERGVIATLAIPESDGAIRCAVCAHRCLVRPGRAGICRVRENRDGRLLSLAYGQVVAANADPIEKKPLFHVYPGSVAFSIATRGCNFHCANCQNWAISQAERDGSGATTYDMSPREVVAAALAAGSRSIAYTYTEPTVFIEYALETAKLARESGLANLLVTNGYQTAEALDLFSPVIDAANVDLKAFDDRFYRKVVGARLAPVLETLVGMRERGIWVEVTTLLIPGLNDGPEELLALAHWIATELGPETPWHVSRFFPTYRLTDLDPTPVATVRRAIELGHDAGLRHVYSGNLWGGDDDTRCAGCGETLIRRHGFRATKSASLVAGRCARCGHGLAGIGLADVVGARSSS